jgi:predicted NBD/HSP70 family sugar kinase
MEASDARRENRRAILRTVAWRKESTRQQIIDDTGLSKATVSRLVRQLIADGSIIETRSGTTSGAGRPTEILRFRGVSDLVCGVDIGGTNTRFLLATHGAQLVANWRDETPHGTDGAALAVWVMRQVEAACASRGLPDPTALVVGVPGTVERESGAIRNAPNLPAIVGRDFGTTLGRLASGRTLVENDSNLALVGELRAGAAVGHDNAVMITIGTGVGVGVALGRRLVTGAAGTVGEFGVMPVDLDGTPLESVISGTGIAAAAARLGLRDVRPEAILDAAPRGRRGALQHRVGDALYSLIVTLGVAYEPSVIVLGGGVAASLDRLLPTLQARADEVLTPCPRLVMSRLGDPGGAVGATAGALQIVNEMVGDELTSDQQAQLDSDVSAITAQLENREGDHADPGTPADATSNGSRSASRDR